MAIVVNQSSDIKTLADLQKASKAQPGKITFAAPQLNSVPHLTGEVLGQAMGAPMMTVPYTGSPQAITALLSNEAVVTIDGAVGAAAQYSRGQIPRPGRDVAGTSARLRYLAPGIGDLQGHGVRRLVRDLCTHRNAIDSG